MKNYRWIRGFTSLAVAGALLVLPACDSDPTGDSGERSAVLSGSVEETSQAGVLADAQGVQASMVAAGTLRGDGSLDVLAEAQVDADGSFRIEGVPAGRAGLVVRAENASAQEVGRVIVHQETQAETETRVAPINAGTTLHANVVLEVHGGNPDPASSAEVALRVMASGDGAAASSGVQTSTVASAVIAAGNAESAVLAGQGAAIDATTRSELVLAAMLDLEQSLAAGADFESSHRAFVNGSVAALIDAGVEARSMAAAQAAATTALEARLSSESAVHFEALRSALRMNLEARSRLLAEANGTTAGVAELAAQVVAELGAHVEAATSVAELRAGFDQSRAGLEARLTSTVTNALPGLPIELVGSVEAQLRTTLAQAELWGALEASASAGAMASAVAQWEADVEAAVHAWIDTLPSDIAAEVDVSASVTAFAALGAGPAIH